MQPQPAASTPTVLFLWERGIADPVGSRGANVMVHHISEEPTPMALGWVIYRLHQGRPPERPTLRFAEMTPLASQARKSAAWRSWQCLNVMVYHLFGEPTPMAFGYVGHRLHQGRPPERPTLRFAEMTPLASRARESEAWWSWQWRERERC